jgi:LmbE family N-acetylglucosaminyl deacetylase
MKLLSRCGTKRPAVLVLIVGAVLSSWLCGTLYAELGEPPRGPEEIGFRRGPESIEAGERTAARQAPGGGAAAADGRENGYSSVGSGRRLSPERLHHWLLLAVSWILLIVGLLLVILALGKSLHWLSAMQKVRRAPSFFFNLQLSVRGREGSLSLYNFDYYPVVVSSAGVADLLLPSLAGGQDRFRIDYRQGEARLVSETPLIVNGMPRREKQLRSGDRIIFGSYRLQFKNASIQEPALPAPKKPALSWQFPVVVVLLALSLLFRQAVAGSSGELVAKAARELPAVRSSGEAELPNSDPTEAASLAAAAVASVPAEGRPVENRADMALEPVSAAALSVPRVATERPRATAPAAPPELPAAWPGPVAAPSKVQATGAPRQRAAQPKPEQPLERAAPPEKEDSQERAARPAASVRVKGEPAAPATRPEPAAPATRPEPAAATAAPASAASPKIEAFDELPAAAVAAAGRIDGESKTVAAVRSRAAPQPRRTDVRVIVPGRPIDFFAVDMLFIHAHPDDESIDFGTLMSRASRSGKRIVTLLFTDGEAGLDLYPQRKVGDIYPARPLKGESLSQVRVVEATRALSILGAELYIRWGLRNRPYNTQRDVVPPEEVIRGWGGEQELVDRLIEVLEGFRPQVVVSPDGRSAAHEHFEHEAVGDLVAKALEQLRQDGGDYVKGHLVSVDPCQQDRYTGLVGVDSRLADPESGLAYRDIQMLALREHISQRDASVIAINRLARYPDELYKVRFWDLSGAVEEYLH